MHKADEYSTLRRRRNRNITSDPVLFEDGSAICLYARQALQESFAIRHAGRILFLRDKSNLGDRRTALFDNERFTVGDAPEDLACLEMEFVHSRFRPHVTHCDTNEIQSRHSEDNSLLAFSDCGAFGSA